MTAASYAPVQTALWDIPELLEGWARRTPAAVAVISDQGTRTYAQLADDVAHYSARLVAAGVGPEVSVAVVARRSYPLVVAFLAIMRSGGIYVPVQPDLPEARQQALLQATRPRVLLAAPTLAAWAHQLCPASATVLQVSPGHRDPAPGVAPLSRSVATHPNAGAYVIQTSGSTGAPKSIQTHRAGLGNLIAWYTDTCELTSDSRVAQVISGNFDASVKNYLAPFTRGAALVLLPDGPYDPQLLLAFIAAHRITVLNCIPSMFYPVVDAAGPDGFDQLASLRVLAFGTETPDLGPLAPWMESGYFRARVLNLYGPTECTVLTCCATIS